MSNPKWTIGMVNYKSSIYIEYQLKNLYEFNNPDDFKLIIIDNSNPHEKQELESAITPYKKYNNCEIIYFNPSLEPWMRGSGQHGEGLNEVLKRTDTKFLLVHDPDFFFVQQNYLKIIEQELENGNLTIGAPYRGSFETGEIGKYDFPSAFGAAYVTSQIKDLDFNPSLNKEKLVTGSASCIDPDGADVGWKMRDKLSAQPYKSFTQKRERVLRSLGKYSCSISPYSYYLNGKLIAYHLFRGTFIDAEDKFMISKIDQITPAQWTEVRKKYARYFYNEMLGDRNAIFRIKNRLLINYLYIFHGALLNKIIEILIYNPFCQLSKRFYKLPKTPHIYKSPNKLTPSNGHIKVSVIMSSYNHDKFITDAIKSVVSQSFGNWELLIMDDCSTDKTFQIAKNFEAADSRIKVFQSPYNRGMVQNTNELIKLSRGEYIAIINSDDSWQIEKLKKQVEFLNKNPEYGACFTSVHIVDDDGKIIKQNQRNYTDAFCNIKNRSRYGWLNHFFYFGNSLCYPSSMVRKSCYEKVGFFNPAFICLLDLDMWIRICLSGYEIHIIKEELTNFRMLNSGNNLSAVNQSTVVRGCLENQRIFYNYSKIKDFDEFIKIFPEYSKTVVRSYEGRVYLLDLIIKSFLSFGGMPNSRNIQNFGLSFLQDQISENPDCLKILERDFDFSFKKYLQITSLYPSGIDLYNKKMTRRNSFYYMIKTILSQKKTKS